MNLKSILKIYTLERQLNPDDIALLNTLRGMNESERELLVSSLAPTPQKKVVKKSNKGASKSPRASSLQAQIQGRGKTATTGNGDDPDALCSHKYESGMVCESSSGNPVHDATQGYAGYHPFQPEQQIATAQSAAR